MERSLSTLAGSPFYLHSRPLIAGASSVTSRQMIAETPDWLRAMGELAEAVVGVPFAASTGLAIR